MKLNTGFVVNVPEITFNSCDHKHKDRSHLLEVHKKQKPTDTYITKKERKQSGHKYNDI